MQPAPGMRCLVPLCFVLDYSVAHGGLQKNCSTVMFRVKIKETLMDNEFQVDGTCGLLRNETLVVHVSPAESKMNNRMEEVEIYTWWRIKMKLCDEGVKE